MYEKSRLTFLSDVVCWIPTSVVHRFNEIVHILKAFAIVTSERLNLSTIVLVCHFLSATLSLEWGYTRVSVTRKSLPIPCRDYENNFQGPNFVSP